MSQRSACLLHVSVSFASAAAAVAWCARVLLCPCQCISAISSCKAFSSTSSVIPNIENVPYLRGGRGIICWESSGSRLLLWSAISFMGRYINQWIWDQRRQTTDRYHPQTFSTSEMDNDFQLVKSGTVPGWDNIESEFLAHFCPKSWTWMSIPSSQKLYGQSDSEYLESRQRHSNQESWKKSYNLSANSSNLTFERLLQISAPERISEDSGLDSIGAIHMQALNSVMSLIILNPTPMHWLPVLANIEPS